jgi:hypothetical protein
MLLRNVVTFNWLHVVLSQRIKLFDTMLLKESCVPGYKALFVVKIKRCF